MKLHPARGAAAFVLGGAALLTVLIAGVERQVGTAGTAPVSRAAVPHPLYFEANRGQADPAARWLHRGRQGEVLLTDAGAVVRPTSASRAIRLSPVGGRITAPTADRRLQGRVNYLIGDRPEGWHRNVPTAASARYAAVWPGVDLVYHFEQDALEYDVVVAPGAGPGRAVLAFEGADSARITAEGDLALRLGAEELRHQRPLAYQLRDGERVAVNAAFRLLPPGGDGAPRAGFTLGAYDPRRPLVIDPVMTFFGFVGGEGADEADGVATDPRGNILLTGRTRSIQFPSAGALSDSINGTGDNSSFEDAFVMKLDPRRSGADALVYATYLGGRANDNGNGIAVDQQGSAVVVGSTNSTNFPQARALQNFSGFIGGEADAFLTRLSHDGSGIDFSTYFGGLRPERGAAVSILGENVLAITGDTASQPGDNPPFPLASAAQAAYGGGVRDAFVAVIVIGPEGSALRFSTYLGGEGNDNAFDIAASPTGGMWVVGLTLSNQFPVRSARQPTPGGNQDGFAANYTEQGQLSLSTYLGGTARDLATGVAVTSDGSARVGGITESFDMVSRLEAGLPAPVPSFQRFNAGGPSDGFLLTLKSEGRLADASYYGGSGTDQIQALDVNILDETTITGASNSTRLPPLSEERPGPFGGADVLVSRATYDGGVPSLAYTARFGTAGNDIPIAIALDIFGHAYVAGGLASPAVFSGPSDQTNVFVGNVTGGGSDGFVIRVREDGDTIVVNDQRDAEDADPDPGNVDTNLTLPGNQVTLRAAMVMANKGVDPNNPSAPDRDRIVFDIPSPPSETVILQPATALPALTESVMVLGQTQPTGPIRISGESLPAGANGFVINGVSACALSGLEMVDIPGNAVSIQGGVGNLVDGLKIGEAKRDGDGCGLAGILVVGGKNHRLLNCVLRRCTQAGVDLRNTRSCLVSGNHIGIPPQSGLAGGGQVGLAIAGGFGCQVVSNTIGHALSHGISISEGDRHVVEGNFIGVRQDGTGGGNGGDGISVEGSRALGHQIGTSELPNTIAKNGGAGVRIRTSSGASTQCVVESNVIGVSPDLTTASPNSGSGVVLEQAGGNLVLSNLISGNQGDGVKSEGAGSDENLIADNSIGLGLKAGTTTEGIIAIPNAGDGVHILNAPNNQVFGLLNGQVIAGNRGAGVHVEGPAATSAEIVGNQIGIEPGSKGAFPGEIGILIERAPLATLGGTVVEDANVIGATTLCGVLIKGAAAIGTQVLSNVIGVPGIPGSANPSGIIVQDGASDTQIGSLASGTGPTISLISDTGIEVLVGARNTRILVATIIDKPAGELNPKTVGIRIVDAPTTSVGNASSIVSLGRLGLGIRIAGSGSTECRIRRCEITDCIDGIDVDDAPKPVIGEDLTDDEFAVSIENSRQIGVSVHGNAAAQTVLRNLSVFGAQTCVKIHAGASGVSLLNSSISGALLNGVQCVDVANSSIGDVDTQNEISGCGGAGVLIRGNASAGSRVIRNRIFLCGIGVLLADSQDITVGPENVIQDNSERCIHVLNQQIADSRHRIVGNTLRQPEGILVDRAREVTIGDTSGNFISGCDRSAILLVKSDNAKITNNRISNNKSAALELEETSGANISDNGFMNCLAGGIVIRSGERNRLSGNAFPACKGLPIDLGGNGVLDPIDVGDADAGANTRLNAPLLDKFERDETGAPILRGRYIGAPSITVKLEFFLSTTSNAETGGTGAETQIGIDSLIDLTTDEDGRASFNLILVGFNIPGGGFLTATARDELGNTSETSRSLEAKETKRPDLIVRVTDPAVRSKGQGRKLQATIDFTLTLTNGGEIDAPSSGVLAVFLSPNRTLDARAIEIGRLPGGPVPLGSTARRMQAKPPRGVDPRRMFLIAVVDLAEEVDEVSDSNNQAAVKLPR